MGGAVAVGTLQLQHNLTGAIALEPFVGNSIIYYSNAQIPPSDEYLYRDPEYSLDVCVS
jgi:hypothetical protein